MWVAWAAWLASFALPVMNSMNGLMTCVFAVSMLPVSLPFSFPVALNIVIVLFPVLILKLSVKQRRILSGFMGLTLVWAAIVVGLQKHDFQGVGCLVWFMACGSLFLLTFLLPFKQGALK